MCGQNEHFGNLHMGWGIGSIDGHISDVVTSEGFDALVKFCSTVGIAMEADIAEVGLHEAWLEVGDADGRVGHVDAETVGEGFYAFVAQ